MSEKQYLLSPLDRQRLDELLAGVARWGGLFACDSAGQPVRDAGGRPAPVEYVILPSRQYLLDAHKRVWRFLAEGTPKDPAAPGQGGAPWRNSRVEMWNGRWRPERRAGEASDQPRTVYVKCLSARPIDKRINGQPGISQIEWYCKAKGYRHPLDGPDELTPEQFQAWLTEQPAARPPEPTEPTEPAAAAGPTAPAEPTAQASAAEPSPTPQSPTAKTRRSAARDPR